MCSEILFHLHIQLLFKLVSCPTYVHVFFSLSVGNNRTHMVVEIHRVVWNTAKICICDRQKQEKGNNLSRYFCALYNIII